MSFYTNCAASTATRGSHYPIAKGQRTNRSPTIAKIVQAAIVKSRMESMGAAVDVDSKFENQRGTTETIQSSGKPKKRLAWYVDSLIFNKTLQEVDEDHKTKFSSFTSEKQRYDPDAVTVVSYNSQLQGDYSTAYEEHPTTNNEETRPGYVPGFKQTDFDTNFKTRYKSKDYTKFGLGGDSN